MTKPHLLIIEDDLLVGRALARCVRVNFDVVCVSSAEIAIRRLEAGQRWDVILCDEGEEQSEQLVTGPGPRLLHKPCAPAALIDALLAVLPPELRGASRCHTFRSQG